jgi:penicillin-binding protein 1A
MPDAPGPSSPPPAGPRPRPLRQRRFFRWTVPLILALLIGAITGVAVAAAIHMPRVDALVDYTPSLVTQLHARDGSVFATFARERRVMLTAGQVPPLLQQAVLASEDSNFYQHGGVDALGIARAAITDVRAGKVVEGASTITMQLARSLFLSRERTWRRKVEEALLAVELEKSYSKPQILTLYLNLVNLGHGNYGVEAAARYYFGKPAAKLTLTEVATLIGIIPAPSRYSPYRQPKVVLSQRDRVLRRMFDEGYITRAQYDEAVAQPLLVATQQQEEIFAPYFAEDIRKYLEGQYGATTLYEGGLQVRTTLDRQIQQATEEAVRGGLLRLDHRRGFRGPIAHLEGDLEEQELPTWVSGRPVPGRWYQGLVLSSGTTAEVKIANDVYTLDGKGIAWTRRSTPGAILKAGDVAWFRLEEEKAKDIKDPKDSKDEDKKDAKAAAPAVPAAPAALKLMLEQEPRMQSAAVVIEHRTGAIRGMTGGFDFQRNKFNRITQAKRQVGSAFKPFVYGAALEAGWTPSDTLLDAPTYFRGGDGRMSYRPENYYKKHYGIVTLRRALEQSINVPAVKLWDLVGGQRVIDFSQRCGIRTKLPNYPSISLGAADLIPLELAAGFATFANQGTYIEPYLIQRVSGPDGHTLEQHFPATYTSTTAATAYVLTHMMEGVIDHGTAFDLSKLPIDIAGKTGTTDDFSDAWFVGYTPRYTILTWVGYDQKRSLGSGMSGAVAAVPIWKAIADKGLKDGWIKPGEKFTPPPGVSVKNVEYYSGLLSQGGGRTIQEAFVAGTEPARAHSNQWSTINSLPWFQQKAFYIPKEGENMPGKKPEGPKGPTAAPKAEDDPGPKESPAPAATPALVRPAATPPPG